MNIIRDQCEHAEKHADGQGRQKDRERATHGQDKRDRGDREETDGGCDVMRNTEH